MASKKITAMTEVTTLESTDWVTGIDNSAALANKNVKITKANLQAGLATVGSVTGVSQDLAAHESATGDSAHTGMALQSDIDTHAGGRNGTAAHITSAERTEWDAKVDDSDLGNAAGLDVGTTAGTVAAGNAPADAVIGHESTYDHANLPTTAQKAGLAGNAGSGADPYAVESQLVTAHDALTGLTENDQHPGNAIYITGATAGNAVSVDAAGRLVDSGEPPGGTVESTRTKVSATDSYNGYLEEKIVAGADITVTTNGAAASPQTLVIEYSGSSGLRIGGSADTRIFADNASDVEIGAIGQVDDGIFLAHGNGVATDGGIWAGPEILELYGAATTINHLKHEDPAGYQTVSVSPDGYLFGESPPDPGWTVTETDASDYDTFGTGTGVGPWVEIAGCAANPVEQILVGDAFNLYSQVYVSNTSGRNVVVEMGYGLNGAEPAYTGSTYLVVEGQVGYLPPDLTVVASSAAQYETSDVISLWVRRASGDHNNATFEVIGSTFESPCKFTLSVPSSSSGGTGGIPDAPDASNYVRTVGAWNLANAAAVGAVPATATLTTAAGLSGGGNLVDNLTIKVTATGVVAAEYTNPTITVDSMGRITAAANGSAGGSSFPARRVVNATTGGVIDVAVDGGAVTVNVNNGNAVTLNSSGSGQDDSANEYTVSVDFVHAGSGGDVSVSLNAAIENMNDFGAITVAPGLPVTAILRTRADGTVQIWRSAKVTS